MGRETAIEWADSTLNLMMGCDGCELAAKGGSGTCYAEVLTGRYAGSSKGYPADFYSPKLFPERLAVALRWPDLTSTERPEKPWLNGRPRHIFLDDMGDTFTESLPLDWLLPHIPAMEASPNIWQFLTKRPARMRRFFEMFGRVPENFHLGTSVTDDTARLRGLCKIPDAMLWVSAEPLIAPIDLRPFLPRLSWCVIGGESGPKARPVDVAWIRTLIEQCSAVGSPAFVKQLGAFPCYYKEVGTAKGGATVPLKLHDRKGGDPSEWFEDLRVREMPLMEVSRG